MKILLVLTLSLFSTLLLAQTETFEVSATGNAHEYNCSSAEQVDDFINEVELTPDPPFCSGSALSRSHFRCI